MSASPSPFVLDASPETFDALVLGNSAKGLVLAYFWSPRAGPCLVLRPRLIALAAAYGGRFLLVMANTDELGRQARQYGVTSVPTVKFFWHGAVAHTVHGAEPDSAFHAALSRFLASEDDQARLAALAQHQTGDTPAAIAALARLAVEQPDDLAVAADLAKLLTLSGRADEALALLSGLPAQARADKAIAALLIHLELIDAAQHGPDDAEADLRADPQAHAARLALAARALFDDDAAGALEHLLHLALHAAGFRDDIGRRALLGVFALLGAEHPLTRAYRARLAALHS